MLTSQEKKDAVTWRNFVFEEAKWLDSIVRTMLPSFLVKFVEFTSQVPGLGWFGRTIHFVVDFLVVGKILGLKIKRVRNDVMKGGKGWRPGHGVGVLDSIDTVIEQRGKEIHRKNFKLDIIISK